MVLPAVSPLRELFLVALATRVSDFADHGLFPTIAAESAATKAGSEGRLP